MQVRESLSMRRTAIVVAGARFLLGPRLTARLGSLDDPLLLAADSGAESIVQWGQLPHLVVGDLDSLVVNVRADLLARGVTFERHPRDKDETDGELAIRRALSLVNGDVFLLGFLGGTRLDQEAANLLQMARLPLRCILLDEQNEARCLDSAAPLAWEPELGEIISLLPLGGDATGIVTRGLRGALHHETLAHGSTRGVSNEPVLSGELVTIAIASGQLLVTRHFPDR